MTEPNLALTFKHGDDTWKRLRKRAEEDFYWFNAVVLGFMNVFEMHEDTHLLLHRYMQRNLGNPVLDEAPIQMLQMPRETGKSTCGTVGYAVWMGCKHPECAILIANEKEETAKDFIKAIKWHFEANALLRALFPEVIPPDLNKTEWSSTRATLQRATGRPEATFDCTGVGGTKVGKHYDIILCDDIISKEGRESAIRQSWVAVEETQRWVAQLRPLLSAAAREKLGPGFPFIRFIGCIAEGEPVLMADGTWKPIQDVQIGDKVWACKKDGSEGFRSRAVAGVWPQGESSVVELNVAGRRLRCTEDHPLLCASGREDGAGRSWKPAKQFAREHASDPERRGPMIEAFEGMPGTDLLGERSPDLDLYWLCGFLWGDGWNTRCERPNGSTTYSVCIALGVDAELNDRAIASFLKHFGGRGYETDFGYVRFDNTDAGRTLEDWGLFPGVRAPKKRLPEWLFQSKSDAKRAFLRGLGDADGHWCTDKRYQLGVSSKDLAEAVHKLALTCYVRPSSICHQTKVVQPPNSPEPVHSDVYYLYLNFLDRTSPTHRYGVKTVTKLDAKMRVYDLTIEDGDCAFVVSGLCAGNTRWFHGDTYEYIEKSFSYGEDARRFNCAVKLANGQKVGHEIYRSGDLSVLRVSGIENGKASFPLIWPLERIEKWRYEDPELVSCLPLGEKLLTDQGPKPIELIGEGDNLLTHTGVYNPVAATSIRPYNGTLVKIKLYGQSHPVSLTANHRLWAQPALIKTGRWQATGEFDWMRADEIKRGDLVEVPFDTTERDVSHINPHLSDPDFWFLIGHFLGDGWCQGDYLMIHCFNKKDTELAERVQGIVRRLFKRKANITETRTTLKISYSHPDVRAFFRTLIQPGLSHKWLPHELEQAPTALQQHLIDGYWAADGCTLKSGRKVAVSVCHELLCQMQRLLARCGTIASVTGPKKNTTVIEGRKVNAQPLWALWIYEYSRNKKLKAWIEDGHMYRRVREVRHVPFAGPVFNCEVVEDHSYVAASNAVAYANCNILNDPSDAAIRTFHDDWLIYWTWASQGYTISYPLGDGTKRQVAVNELVKRAVTDPAFTSNASASRAAVVIVGTDMETGKHLILDVSAKQQDPKDNLEDFLNMCEFWKVTKAFVELAGQQLAYLQWLQSEARNRNLPLSIDTVKPGGRAKDVRIEGLLVPFKQGSILAHPSQHEFLEEYRSWRPGSRMADVLDALAYVVEEAPKPRNSAQDAARQRSQAQLNSYYQRRGMKRAGVT